MEHNQNSFVPDAATDEPAVASSTSAGAADALDFHPVALRERHDGWTPAKQRQFVEALADTGVVRHAAALVNMTEQSVNRLRRRSDARAFDLACEAAARLGARQLHSIAYERAVEGTIKRHYYHGELKSEERVYNDRLLIYLLGRTERLLDPPPETDEVIADWDGWMDAIEQGLPEPPEPEAEIADTEFDGSEVWQDANGWWTCFPPPADYEGFARGTYGQGDYARELTDEEMAVIATDEAADLADAAARRDYYFGFDGEEDDFPPLLAEPSEPLDDGEELESSSEAPSPVRPEPVEGLPFPLPTTESMRLRHAQPERTAEDGPPPPNVRIIAT